jgi:hypothetical protein
MTSLGSLLAGRADVWRGRTMAAACSAGEPTGYPELDALLPGGGWPRGALIEILPASVGSGAMELVLPVLARLSTGSRWIVLLDPPFRPFAPGFAGHGVRLERLLWVRPRQETECLWAMEQALRSGACSAVLGWPGVAMPRDAVRRLQLAAEAAEVPGYLFLSPAAAGQLSAAALRLQVRRRGMDLEVEVLKRRGAWALPPRRLRRGSLAGIGGAGDPRPSSPSCR